MRQQNEYRKKKRKIRIKKNTLKVTAQIHQAWHCTFNIMSPRKIIKKLTNGFLWEICLTPAEQKEMENIPPILDELGEKIDKITKSKKHYKKPPKRLALLITKHRELRRRLNELEKKKKKQNGFKIVTGFDIKSRFNIDDVIRVLCQNWFLKGINCSNGNKLCRKWCHWGKFGKRNIQWIPRIPMN